MNNMAVITLVNKMVDIASMRGFSFGVKSKAYYSDIMIAPGNDFNATYKCLSGCSFYNMKKEGFMEFVPQISLIKDEPSILNRVTMEEAEVISQYSVYLVAVCQELTDLNIPFSLMTSGELIRTLRDVCKERDILLVEK